VMEELLPSRGILLHDAFVAALKDAEGDAA
jgi:hypothetical protein